jgi:hypothetical protein
LATVNYPSEDVCMKRGEMTPSDRKTTTMLQKRSNRQRVYTKGTTNATDE